MAIDFYRADDIVSAALLLGVFKCSTAFLNQCVYLQALGSRSIPTRQAVEEELAKVSDPKGDPSWFDDYLAEHQTALAKDPADYFAFIG